MTNLILNGQGVATAALNPGRVLDVAADAYRLLTPGTDTEAYLVTVLKAGGAGDLAAYAAIVAGSSYRGDRAGACEWVCRYGQKLRSRDAEKLFRWSERGEYRA